MQSAKPDFCQTCPRWRGHMVLDQEPVRRWNKLVIVGEAPGKEEVRRGLAFVGSSSSMLRAGMGLVGVNPEETYFTNVIACGRLPGQVESDDERAAMICQRRLDDLLEELQPGAALGLGGVAWTALTGLTGVTKYRGTVAVPETTGRPYPCVCTMHTAALMRQEAFRPMIDMIIADVRKAAQLATGKIQVWRPEVEAAKFDVVEPWLAAILATPEMPVALDIETYKGPNGESPKDALGCRILCLGVAGNGRSFCLPLGGLFEDYYTPDEHSRLMELIQKVLDTPGRPVVFQNLTFDVPVLQRLWFPGPWSATIHDTLLMHHALFPKCPHDLQAIASHFFPIEPWKEYFDADWSGQQSFDGNAHIQYYNAVDALTTLEAYKTMWPMLKAAELDQVYERDRQLALIALDWMRVGVLVDDEVRQELAKGEQAKILELLVKIRGMTGIQRFNPASPQQVADVLVKKFGLVPTVTTKTGKISTGATALFQFRHHPFVRALLAHRDASKLYGTYIKGIDAKTGDDGRLHSKYNVASTPTGRFGTEPAIQNWPKPMRQMLVAPPGYLVVTADYKALELRIIALLSAEEELIARFLNEEDVHAYNAENFYFSELWPDADKDRRKELRKLGKSITFGDNYLATAETLYENIREEDPSVTLFQVRDLQARLRNRYPRKLEWAELMRLEAERTGELRTPWLGRRRMWPFGGVPATEAANFPIQGGAGDIVGERTVVWVKLLKQKQDYHNRVWPNCQIHDALYSYVREDYAEQAARDMAFALPCVKTHRSVVNNKLYEMRFSVDVAIGPNFLELKERPDLLG